MEFVYYLRAVRRRWLVVAAAAVVAGLVGWFTAVAAQQTDTEQVFEATHILAVDPGGSSEVSLERVALLGTTGEVPRRVADELNSEVPAPELADQVQTEADAEVGTVTFTARGTDAQRVAELANTFARTTVEYFEERGQAQQQEQVESLTQRVEEINRRISELDRQIAAASGSRADTLSSQRDALVSELGNVHQELAGVQLTSPSTGITTLEEARSVPAEEPGFAIPSNPRVRAALGGLVGLLLGVGLAVFLDRIDERIRTRDDAQAAFRLPVIGEIPRQHATDRDGSITTVEAPASFVAESYRLLRLAIQSGDRWRPSLNQLGLGGTSGPERVSDEAPVEVLVVTSPGPGEGKTTAVANLAASFAEAGKSVLVIDLDYRHAEQHRYFQVDREPGMTAYLTRGQDELSLGELARESPVVEGVRVVPNGAMVDNPGGLDAPDNALVKEARNLADVVIIDTGPILAVNEPGELAPYVDRMLLVAHSTRTGSEAAGRATDMLARQSAPVAGVALVGVAEPDSPQPYYQQVRSVPADSGSRRRSQRARRRRGESQGPDGEDNSPDQDAGTPGSAEEDQGQERADA